MQTTVQKWGNSLGLRIPRSMTERLSVEAGTIVEIEVVGDQITIRPIVRQACSLQELLAGVTDENMHAVVDFGASVGREDW
jgi:antitoxin MazE